MPYSSYRGPGVDVTIEQREVEQRSPETQFYPVFVGMGVTSRNRNIEKTGIRANVEKFPQVTLTFPLVNDINFDLFNNTKFDLGQVIVTKSSVAEGGATTVTLEPTTGYTVVQGVTLSTSDYTGSVVLNIVSTDVNSSDAIYELNITASNVDADFDLRAIGTENRFFSKELFGPVVLEENGEQFFNDVAIAADIAFRMGVQRFYYLEVPRDYGETPTSSDFKNAIDKIYYYEDAYRIVPLTSDAAVINTVNQFINAVANPKDRRETISFLAYDATKLTNINDMSELVTKVGGLSQSLDNSRVCNVFAGESVEYRIEDQVYVLPTYFAAAAVCALDAVVGKVQPLSLREISIFERINGPRFRPIQWDELAKCGVLIVIKENDAKNAYIRHQLTTAQSNKAADQEISVVKNYDVVTKKFRDRLKVYSGQYNVDAGYLEKLQATQTTVIQELLEERLANAITVVTPWQAVSNGDGRDLVTRLSLSPVYPANHLDVFLII